MFGTLNGRLIGSTITYGYVISNQGLSVSAMNGYREFNDIELWAGWRDAD